VRAGWRELEQRVQAAARPWTGAIVQPLVAPGADVLVGAVRDRDFGPVMAIGLGGRQAGLARTVAFRVLPVTDVEAAELLDASESAATQLNGFRGSPPLDREALRNLILRFAHLPREAPEIVDADLNPVRCLPEGLRGPRHAAARRAPAADGARQDLVIAGPTVTPPRLAWRQPFSGCPPSLPRRPALSRRPPPAPRRCRAAAGA
jgi:hypothetical protein